MEDFRATAMKADYISFIFFYTAIFILSACSAQGKLPDYLGQEKSATDLAIFARVGASPDGMKTATNYLKVSRTLKNITVDDLSGYISPCKLADTLFCLKGGLPIILPKNTGSFQYKMMQTRSKPKKNGTFTYHNEEVVVDVDLSAPTLDDKWELVTDRKTCDVSMSKLTVSQGDDKYVYIISKQHGVVSITQITARETQTWYLVAGRLIDLGSLCKIELQ